MIKTRALIEVDVNRIKFQSVYWYSVDAHLRVTARSFYRLSPGKWVRVMTDEESKIIAYWAITAELRSYHFDNNLGKHFLPIRKTSDAKKH